MPSYGPARNRVHESVAALILRAFEGENPSSDIREEDTVAIRISRHGYIKETSYVAGYLRTANLNELTIMTERFLQDSKVTSETLEPATPGSSGPAPNGPEWSITPRIEHDVENNGEAYPLAVPDIANLRRERVLRAAGCGNERRMVAANALLRPVAQASVTRTFDSSDATVVGRKRQRSKTQGRRVVTGQDGTSLSLPWGIYPDSTGAGQGITVRLKMQPGAYKVNGEECVSRKKVRIIDGVPATTRNIAALR